MTAVKALCESMPDFTDESRLQQCAHQALFLSEVQLLGCPVSAFGFG